MLEICRICSPTSKDFGRPRDLERLKSCLARSETTMFSCRPENICKQQRLKTHITNYDCILLSSLFCLPILLSEVDEPESSFFSRMTLKCFPSVKKKITKDITKLSNSLFATKTAPRILLVVPHISSMFLAASKFATKVRQTQNKWKLSGN